MRGRGRIWGVNERKGGYVDGGKKKKKSGTWMVGKKKKKKKERGTGTEGERGKKIEKRRYFGSCKKKKILKNKIIKLK
jgi:hypothetical protein